MAGALAKLSASFDRLPIRVRLAGVSALLTFVIAALFDLLFLAVSELPATVPVALALILLEVRDRARKPHPALARADCALGVRPR